ncbi:MAG TPA: ABC transporter substrate-binding protein, partial [Candidatus Paceibacterota bacterium]|nr:ABC transporter substrate-binding protein [Candidatus Paceibacterota bacterium]
MTKNGKLVVWIVVIFLVVWGIVAMSKKKIEEPATIKIGFVGPLTGDLANMGANAQAAVGIALDEINNAGGVLGKKLEVVYEDDVCTGAGGANAVSKLINTDKVVAVLGGVCSGATLGEAPITEAAKVPQLAFC